MTITIDYQNKVRTLMVHKSTNINKTKNFCTSHFKSLNYKKKNLRHNTMEIYILIWDTQKSERFTPVHT